MPTAWEKNAHTYCPEARRREADRQADLHNVFRRDGFQAIGYLGPEMVKSLQEAVGKMRFEDEGVIDRFEFEEVLAVPAFKQIANLPEIILPVAMHLGATPKIVDVSLWRTRPGEGGKAAAQDWHRDVDDWRAAKLFVYLSDVGPEQGPHMFVPGSHRPEFFERRGLVPDAFFYNAGRSPGVAEMVDQFPRLVVTGRAGKMFLENTWGFHRGSPVVSGERLLFQVLYGLMDPQESFVGTKMPAIRKAWG